MADVESVPLVQDDKKNDEIEETHVTVKDVAPIEIESTATLRTTVSEDSEYETLEEDNGLDDENGSIGSRRSSHSVEDGELSGGDSVIIEDERVDGDGEEESEPLKDRKLDDDEDRRNPQYIPKKGTFYEHDDRTLLDAEEDTKPVGPDGDASSSVNDLEEQEPKQKKVAGTAVVKPGGKVWVDKASEKWQHDLYIEDEQRPKSTQELIDTYGYDIRNEEAPPKARRRRRYGRGPNKYTRNWEDEAAYRSPSLAITSRGGRGVRGRGSRLSKSGDLDSPPISNQEEFPVLGERPRRRSTSKSRNSGSGSFTTTSSAVSVAVKKIPRHFNARPKSNDRNQNYISTKRVPEPVSSSISSSIIAPSEVNVIIKDSPIISRVETSGFARGRGRGRTRGGGGAGTGGGGDIGLASKYKMEFTSSRGRGHRLPPPAFTSHGKSVSVPPVSSDIAPTINLQTAVPSVTQKFNRMDISSCTFTPTNTEDNPRPTPKDAILPGVVERRVPDVPPRMHEPLPANAGRSKRYSAQRQRSLPETTYSPPPAATPPQSQQQAPPPQQQQQHPVQYFQPQTQPPISVPDYPPPPVFNEAVPPPQMVAFMPSGPPPPPGTAPPFPPPPIINYVPTPAAFALPLQPPPAVQQAELYQVQNGVTYYSPQTQAALPRQTPPRRMKVAIPILPPPEQPRGRGRSSEQDAKA